MTKVLAIDDPISYAQAKDKPEWEHAMTIIKEDRGAINKIDAEIKHRCK